ncbi:hypothetical protein KKHLCK_10375 [Candidatus Electrothrix laxa]
MFARMGSKIVLAASLFPPLRVVFQPILLAFMICLIMFGSGVKNRYHVLGFRVIGHEGCTGRRAPYSLNVPLQSGLIIFKE